uniref:Aminopeptidase N n=1 Tax=Parastrongyloides trichosuri TaxID=131310 RepID=A0A0N4Z605_PARTI
MEEINLDDDSIKKNNLKNIHSKYDNYPTSLFKQSKTPIPGVSFNDFDDTVLITHEDTSNDSSSNFVEKRTNSSTNDMGRQGTYHPKKKSSKKGVAKISTSSKEPTIIEDPVNKMKTKDNNGKRFSGGCIACLIVFAVLAALTSALVTHLVTLEQCPAGYPNKTIVLDDRFGPDFFKNKTILEDSETDNETDIGQPTAEELRLPKTLKPIWYDLKVKVYLPGFVEIPKNKNLTFDSSLKMKFIADNETDEIILNADQLNLDENDLENKYQLFKYDPTKDSTRTLKVVRRRMIRSVDNTTSEELSVTTASPIIEETVTTIPMVTTATSSSENVTESIESVNITELVTTVQSIENIEGTTESVIETTEKPVEEVTIVEEGMIPSDIKIVRVSINGTLKKVTFKLSENLKKGEKYIFALKYTGIIGNLLRGLYLTKYQSNKKTVLGAVTHMEPDGARQLAPCFDEPEFKAKWKVAVEHPTGTIALSNGIELQDSVDTKDKDWKLTIFKETPPMSSYLLAIAVGNFSYIEGKAQTGTRMRVYSRPEVIDQTKFALEAGIKVLEYYEKYFDEPFPLEKQDLIGLPDFAAGAMENWGLVTYRESALLYDPKIQFPFQKMRVAVVIAHELAHQIFGNEITLKFWDDLWIQEGFATFVEYIGTDIISDGNFRQDEYFVIEAQNIAFNADAKATSHPLFFPITKAEDVEQAFDSITYEKGASIITMLKNVMGEENFKKGVQLYIHEHKYNNTVHQDLWNALETAIPDNLKAWDGSKFDVSDFSNKWIEQMGYPVVYVRRIDEESVELLQKRFKLDENTIEDKKFRNAKYWYKWDIPIWYSINGEEKNMTWLHESTTINTTLKDVIIINTESRGFYRVNYDKFGWEAIIKQLNEDHTKIPTKTRARIIDDAFALAEANLIPYSIPLNITNYLTKETEYIPWSMTMNGLDNILSNFEDDPEVETVEKYYNKLMKPLYDTINWNQLDSYLEDDKHIFENQLKSSIINTYCNNNKSECLRNVLNLFKDNFVNVCDQKDSVSSKCSKIPVMIRKLAYCSGIKYGTDEDWQFVFDRYNNEISQVEQVRLLYALGCTRDSVTKKKMLNDTITIDNGKYRLQNVPTLVNSLSSDPLGRRVSFEYLIDNWKDVHSSLKNTHSILNSFIDNSLRIYRQSDIETYEKFLTEYKSTTKKYDNFKQNLESAKQKKEWREKHMEFLVDWFSKNI